MNTKSLWLAAALFASSCKDNPAKMQDDAYDRWRSFKLHNYTVDQIRNCYCVDGGSSMTVTVRSDTVYRVVRASDGASIPKETAKSYLSVDALFAIILQPHTDSLVVSYDERYGYPVSLDVNPQLHPVDGGVHYLTSNIRIP